MGQLNIFEQINHNELMESLRPTKDEPYRNLRGELLPWEEPEYLQELQTYGTIKT